MDSSKNYDSYYWDTKYSITWRLLVQHWHVRGLRTAGSALQIVQPHVKNEQLQENSKITAYIMITFIRNQTLRAKNRKKKQKDYK